MCAAVPSLLLGYLSVFLFKFKKKETVICVITSVELSISSLLQWLPHDAKA